MIVVVDGPTGSVSLQESDNLTALSVRLQRCDPDGAAGLMADLGHVEDGHAWLNIEALRGLSPRSADPGWNTDFESAMAYARSKGWTDDAGRLVRAHLAP